MIIRALLCHFKLVPLSMMIECQTCLICKKGRRGGREE